MRINRLVATVLSIVLCLQLLPMTTFAFETNSEGNYSITGNGVEVTCSNGELTLYRVDGTTIEQMSRPSDPGYVIVNGQEVRDFVFNTCAVETNITGVMGTGQRMTITSSSTSSGLTRIYVIETSNAIEGAIYTHTSYQTGNSDTVVDWFIDNEFTLYDVEDRIWSYNGGGEGPMHYFDTLQKIDLTDSNNYSRENRQDSTAASIPVADIYTASGGITVGDASAARREVHTPVQETNGSASVSIKWPGKTIAANSTLEAGQSFIIVHSGDYFCGLRGYKNAMECLGIVMQSNIADRSYELRWEAWGWSTNWTIDLIIGKLDELQAAGIKQVTVDDGWYNSAGDWELSPSKFPNGNADMIRLVNAIHDHGMTAILWWRPNDGGTNSTLYQEHPEYYVKQQDGTPAPLPGPGGSNANIGYALCPTSSGAIASQNAFINRAMNVWGFDGFKADYVWSMPKCYDSSHNHPYPEESTEKQAEFYRTAYETMVANDPDCFNLLCNCGTPQDYYSLPYMTQVATADPTSVDQTRRRAKAYKALMGDFFPITTDHNDVWYPSAVGTGSVLIEKRALNGGDRAEYEKWLAIADSVQLHKGQFIGDLYVYGFDPYETYVVKKDGVMHYAFYRDGSKYQPVGNPAIELKGLDPNKMYRIVDYVNDRVVATNLMGNNAVFNCDFSAYLLVKAVEITTPDDPSIVDPDWGYLSVDCMDSSVVYTGTWNDDLNPVFGDGTARYTSNQGSTVEITFVGTAIRWYGQKDSNFGTANVYLDGELVGTVNANGNMQTNVLLFELQDLDVAEHTFKIECTAPTIDIDRFAYIPATIEPEYIKVDDTSDLIEYTGTWTEEQSSEYFGGTAKRSNDPLAYAELAFEGTAARWYGQKNTNLGRANVYLDGVFVSTITVYGQTATGVLLYEITGLEPGQHTLAIGYNAGTFDLDYFEYMPLESGEPETVCYTIDSTDPSLVYSGTWVEENNSNFQNGTACYTSSAMSSVEFAFNGTAVRWYGQNDINFGSAEVYIDNELVEVVNVNGAPVTNKLLFEKANLPEGTHTIRIVCATPVIDVDYFEYESTGN